MNYVIVNTFDIDTFTERLKYWNSRGLFFSVDYVEHVDDPVIQVPGSWGCLKFAYPVPSSVLFEPPDVEYRFSEEQNAWLANGELTPFSIIVAGLYTYFLSREGEAG
jgi:hypothetical protein